MIHKVLIVDDSKLARMSVIKSLSALYPDWKWVEAVNSEEALRSIREARPDIALLDFNMPGQNGLDLAAELLQANPHLPVAVVSANRQQEIINRTTAIGAFFLAKPLTQADLAEFLKAAVDRLQRAKS